MNAADLYREAGIYAEFGRIICIGVGRIEKQADGPHLRVTTLHGDHERDVLERFVDLLDKHYNTDEHWLCGHNGREFDFPFIARRCVVNGLSLPRLLDIAGLKPHAIVEAGIALVPEGRGIFGDLTVAENLMAVPSALRHPPLLDALEGARTARFNREEWDAYIAASMAIQNERGALALARKEGRAEEAARALLTVLEARGVLLPEAARGRILAERDPERLAAWLRKAVTASSIAEVLDDPS